MKKRAKRRAGERKERGPRSREKKRERDGANWRTERKRIAEKENEPGEKKLSERDSETK